MNLLAPKATLGDLWPQICINTNEFACSRSNTGGPLARNVLIQMDLLAPRTKCPLIPLAHNLVPMPCSWQSYLFTSLLLWNQTSTNVASFTLGVNTYFAHGSEAADVQKHESDILVCPCQMPNMLQIVLTQVFTLRIMRDILPVQRKKARPILRQSSKACRKITVQCPLSKDK